LRASKLPPSDNAGVYPLFLWVGLQRALLTGVINRMRDSSGGTLEIMRELLAKSALMQDVERAEGKWSIELPASAWKDADAEWLFAVNHAVLEAKGVEIYCKKIFATPKLRDRPATYSALRAALAKEQEAHALARLISKVRKSRWRLEDHRTLSLGDAHRLMLGFPVLFDDCLVDRDSTAVMAGIVQGFAFKRGVRVGCWFVLTALGLLSLRVFGWEAPGWVYHAILASFFLIIAWGMLGATWRGLPRSAVRSVVRRLGAGYVWTSRPWLLEAAKYYERHGFLLPRMICLYKVAEADFWAGAWSEIRAIATRACSIPSEDNASAHPLYFVFRLEFEMLLLEIDRFLGLPADESKLLGRLYDECSPVQTFLSRLGIDSKQKWLDRYQQLCTFDPMLPAGKDVDAPDQLWDHRPKWLQIYRLRGSVPRRRGALDQLLEPLAAAWVVYGWSPEFPAVRSALAKETAAATLIADVFPLGQPRATDWLSLFNVDSAAWQDLNWVYSEPFPIWFRILRGYHHRFHSVKMQVAVGVAAVITPRRGLEISPYWWLVKVNNFLRNPEVDAAPLFFAAGLSLAKTQIDHGASLQATGTFRFCLDKLLTIIAQNRCPQAMHTVLQRFHEAFPMALAACEKAFQTTGSTGWLWTYVQMVDGYRCVIVREGLRRQLRQGEVARSAVRDAWQPSLPHPGPARHTAGANTGNVRGAVRGAATAISPPAEHSAQDAVEILAPIKPRRVRRAKWLRRLFRRLEIHLATPVPIAPRSAQTSALLDQDALKGLIWDPTSVILYLLFAGNDLIALPIRIDNAEGRAQVLHNAQGLFRVKDAKLGLVGPPVDDTVLVEHQGFIEACVSLLWEAREHQQPISAECLVACDPKAIYKKLYHLLNLDALLALIEPDIACRRSLHLVLIPATELWSLPLHAAMSSDERYLVDQFASVRYGISLATALLQAPSSSRTQPFRGVAFANAYADTEEDQLTRVPDEVSAILELGGEQNWWIHTEWGCGGSATREHFRRRHGSGDVLWCMGHGYCALDTIMFRDRQLTLVRPSLLLRDGPVSDTRMVMERYDFGGLELFYNACCMLGSLKGLERSTELDGFNAVLMMLGCTRVASALWEISEDASVEFARHWLGALKAHAVNPGVVRGPHAFAIALKTAVDGLRAADNRRFDHPYFWAAYSLLGLG
jgi:hypothetical protein